MSRSWASRGISARRGLWKIAVGRVESSHSITVVETEELTTGKIKFQTPTLVCVSRLEIPTLPALCGDSGGCMGLCG